MIEAPVIAAADLDAAIAAQREKKLDSLRRQATCVGYRTCIAVAFVAGSIALMIGAYYHDGHKSLAPYLGPVIAAACSVLFAIGARRRRAAVRLEKELSSR